MGAVAYSYQYSIGLFAYKDRPEERFDALKFVEQPIRPGGEVAQLYYTQIRDLDEGGLKRLRQRAEELDVLLEVHGGVALGKWSKFEDTMQRASTLGSKVIGCSFGFLMRPERINTLDAWDAHTKQCEARLREPAPLAKSLGLTIAVEDHLDFTVEELRDLIKSVNSPNVGVLFDVGNVLVRWTIRPRRPTFSVLSPWPPTTRILPSRRWPAASASAWCRWDAAAYGCGRSPSGC